MLKNLKMILENKKCFKLVCGAGNEDISEIEKLVAIYSKAGCNFFDLSAKGEIIDAAKKGLSRVITASSQDNYHFCISVGIKGDPHIRKAFIDANKCVYCKKCKKKCPQDAILKLENKCKINTVRCIGCGKCVLKCPVDAICFISEDCNLKELLPDLIKKGIDCIELHAIVENDSEIVKKWTEINDCFDGIVSICIDRTKLGTEKMLSRVKKLIDSREPYTTIIQADGAPMSGGEDDYKTTLQAVATAEIFQNENLPAYILLSGGTNSKSTELAKLCGININGVAIGSYARKIVKKYLEMDDLLENESVFNEAVIIAKNLVDISLMHLGDL